MRTGSFTPSPRINTLEKGFYKMKIFRTISAARCAVADRIIITRGAKGKYPYGDERYYNHLVQVSGPSTHNPVKIAKNFRLAYQHNLERIKNTEQILNMFEPPSLMTRIYHRMFKK